MVLYRQALEFSPAELAAMRAFRAEQRAQLERRSIEHPADVTVSVLVHYYRHDCPQRDGRSVAIELKEHYVFSPAHQVEMDAPFSGPGGELMTAHYEVPARRFGWIFTEGKCGACGMTARSAAGRLVDPDERPPGEHALLG